MHVYPLVRGTPLSVLSYLSHEPYERAALVRVPIRKASVPAIVSHCEDARAARAAVRRAGHRLLVIPAQTPHTLIVPALLDAAEHFAHDHIGTVGAILTSIVPQAILDKPIEHSLKIEPRAGARYETLLLQAPHAERMSSYRTLIFDQFAQANSVLLLAPSVEEARLCAARLSEAVPDRAHLIHGALTKKELRIAWTGALAAREPVVVIATLSGIGIPRADFGIIVIERAQSDYYIREMRPHVDVRAVAEAYARAQSIPLLLADSVLRATDHDALEKGRAAQYRPMITRAVGARTTLADMRHYKEMKRGGMRIISDELIERVKKVEKDGSRLFILSGRKGLATSIVCKDCGETVLCERCSAPMSLHTRKGEPTFFCNRCAHLSDSLARCRACTSWNLIPLGGGSELIMRQLARVTALPILRIDAETTKTPRQTARVAEQFLREPSILIGTEQALGYLPQRIPHVAVAAIDALLAISDYAIEERLFALLISLRERAERSLLIQTRTPEHPMLIDVVSGDIRNFEKRELSTRRAFGFPPETAMLSMTLFGKEAFVKKQAARLATKLAKHSPTLVPAHSGTRRGVSVVLRIPASQWPDQHLLALARTLAPQWDIRIRT